MQKYSDWQRSRRRFLLGLSATTALAGVFGWSAKSAVDAALLELDQRLLFLKVSSLITGVQMDRTYLELADKIWAALTKQANAAETFAISSVIERLGALSPEASDDDIQAAIGPDFTDRTWVVRRIAELWYTGYQLGYDHAAILADENPVVIYDEALVWQACEWSKPPVTCGGPFGYWHFSPDGVAQPGWRGTLFGFPDFSNIGRAPIGTGS